MSLGFYRKVGHSKQVLNLLLFWSLSQTELSVVTSSRRRCNMNEDDIDNGYPDLCKIRLVNALAFSD
jgi:hypothetical protein